MEVPHSGYNYMMTATAALIAVIVGVVEAIKRAFNLPVRFVPLLAIVLGVVGVSAFSGFSPDSVFEGVIAGLSACGLYSGVKTTAGL